MEIRPSSLGFTVLLGALAALPPLSIDMGLPAFPALERELGASTSGVGLTLSTFMGAFSIAQLVIGPLSDRYGRRPVLLAGLLLYGIAGGLCAGAASIGALIALRVLQGATAATGTVMAFAIARDVFEGAAARQRLSYVSMVISVAPVIAPTLGGAALLVGGWRAIYGFLGIAGVALLLAVSAGLRETRRPPPVRIGPFGGFARMLGHRRAFGFALTNAAGFGSLFAYVSGSPLVLMGDLHVSAAVYALLFAIISGGIMLGAWTNSRVAHSTAASGSALGVALACSLASAAALLVVTTGQMVGLATLVPLLVVHAYCRGISMPNATHGALEPMGAFAGAASAVLGFLQMATGALSSALVALLYPRLGCSAMALVMTLFSVASLLAWRAAVRQPRTAVAVSAE